MPDDFQYVANWGEVSTQCQNCKYFQTKDDKNACVPPDKTFDEAFEEYGEASSDGHCNYFEKK